MPEIPVEHVEMKRCYPESDDCINPLMRTVEIS